MGLRTGAGVAVSAHMADFTGLADLVASGAADHPGTVVLTEASGRSRSWAELDEEVGRCAAGLGAAGMVAGYRVMIALGNRIEFVAAYLGALRAQVVAVPVNPRSSVEEFARMLADSGARTASAFAGPCSSSPTRRPV